MQNPLADTLINKTMAIGAIGKELNEKGSHTAEDAARIERLYFELGSLVLANIGTLSAALYLHHMMQISASTPVPSKEDLEKQIASLTNVNLTTQ